MTSTPAITASRDGDYALGHTGRELDRLSLQARVFEPYTRRLLVEAGLAPGMRVLDIGCGAGDVSFLAAGIVGPTGEVVGLDKAEPALLRARERANGRGAGNVRFVQADLLAPELDERFDAVIGRLVLMYLRDPGAALAGLAGLLKPGGLTVFQEIDIGAMRSVPETPLLTQAVGWIGQAFTAAGAELRMGMKLLPAFLAAGLPTPAMKLDGIVGGGPDFVGYEMATDIARSLLPVMEKAGIASAREIGLDTLAARLREETVARHGTVVIPELIGAWARKPQA